MSKEFVENRIGSSSIELARKQQKQLSYFTQSEIQQDITESYINAWATRNYTETNEFFLNWVKTVFKDANFLSFFKYHRTPLASARLINNKVKPQLQRVFFAEDAYFKYSVSGKQVEEPEELESDEFNKWMFNALLFNFNDILITDLKDVNTPFRELISIENVVAIESKRGVIKQIAYSASIVALNEEEKNGFIYMNDKEYIFYDEKIEPVLTIPHDLGECPADYISSEAFDNDDIVRESMFSFVREELEEYDFLKTLQRMTDPNGSIPVVTTLATKQNKDGKDKEGSSDKEPMSSGMNGQQAQEGKQVQPDGGLLQTGSVHQVTVPRDAEGKTDIDIVKNFINFHYVPVEALDYLNGRLKEIQDDILSTLIGELKEQTGERKNEKQVASGLFSASDKLRDVSLQLSRIRQRSDYKFLALEHGKDNVSNEAFYGSDFFLESQKDLYDLFELAPNPIERRNILLKSAKNRNRFNKDRDKREEILYALIPYVADVDFNAANDKQIIDPNTFQLQTRFNYWVDMFEAKYGDIVGFWDALKGSDSAKLILINNLLNDIIEKAIVPVPPQEEDNK